MNDRVPAYAYADVIEGPKPSHYGEGYDDYPFDERERYYDNGYGY